MLLTLLPLLLAAASPAATPAQPAPVTRKCLSTRDTRGQRISADTGLFIKTTGGWWRNTAPACPLFAPNRMLDSSRLGENLCRGDFVEVWDNFRRINYGPCALGSWERVADEAVPKP